MFTAHETPSARTIQRLVLCLATMSCLSAVADDAVSVTQETDRLEVTINDQPFATWNYSAELPKPFLLPVRTAAGVVINRDLNDPSDPDHPHHKGMWFAVDEVNDMGFWEERGKIVTDGVEIVAAKGPSAAWRVTNSWKNPDSGVIELTESTVITVHASRVIAFDATLTATTHDVTFGDTKEGLFGFRVDPAMKEKNGGTVFASDGSTTTASCWGKCFAWVDYSGTVDGKPVGVTIMDHPGNFRPSRYHVRDYGLFSISPFGESAYTNGANPEALVVLKKGESLRLRYGIYFHDGDGRSANIPAAWAKFVQLSGD